MSRTLSSGTSQHDPIHVVDPLSSPSSPDQPIAQRSSESSRGLGATATVVRAAGDVVAIVAAWFTALAVVRLRDPGAVVSALPTALRTAGLVAVALLLLSSAGLYANRGTRVRSVELARLGNVALLVAIVASLLVSWTGMETAALAGAGAGTVAFVVAAAWRGLLREWVQTRRISGAFRTPVVVVGGDERIRDTIGFLEEHPSLGFSVRGAVAPHHAVEGMGVERFGDIGDLGATRAVERIGGGAVVVDSSTLTSAQVSQVVRDLGRAGVDAHVTSGLRGIGVRRVRVEPMADETFLHVTPPRLSRSQERLKRALDVVVAGSLAVVTLPLLGILALIVHGGDRGPVLFRQQRLGRNGEPFTLLKLRTMVVDAEDRLAEVADQNRRAGPLFKADRDPRITRVGRILRATSLDELPQLWNVLAGSMSLVGPRPSLLSEFEQFDDDLKGRVQVKPGITGLWQVEARDLPSFDLYRRYDLLYVENWSVGLDIAILLRTATSVALRAARSVVPTRVDHVIQLD